MNKKPLEEYLYLGTYIKSCKFTMYVQHFQSAQRLLVLIVDLK